MEIKTETDSTDITKCSHSNKPITGMYVVSYAYSIQSFECYWHCSDETIHYKSDETGNFCSFRCATTSPITIFLNFVCYIFK